MVNHTERHLFVEGGGDSNQALKTECKRAFAKLLERAGFEGRMPRVVPCGGRRRAFDQSCTAVEALKAGDVAVLLVDAEAAVDVQSPWTFVKQRDGDGWEMPAGAEDAHLHLMVQCMESWIVADRAALVRFFGDGFREAALPAATANLEKVSKADLVTRHHDVVTDQTPPYRSAANNGALTTPSVGLFLDLGGKDTYDVTGSMAAAISVWKQTARMANSTTDPFDPALDHGYGFDGEKSWPAWRP